MTNDEHISEISSAFLEALKAAAQDLAGEYMKRLRTELQPSQSGRNFAPELRDGTALLGTTGTQSDTLEALLDAAAKVTPACGLLVLHGTLANGWNCRGITSTTTFKRSILDCSRGIAAHVVSTCSAAETPVSELDPALVSRLGLYGKSRVGLVPILLRNRPVALLLALLPMGDELPALEVLAHVARMTLELQFYRGSASEHATSEHAVAAEAAPEVHEPAAHAAAPTATHESVSADAPDHSEPPTPVAEPAAVEHATHEDEEAPPNREVHAVAESAVDAADEPTVPHDEDSVPAEELPATAAEEFSAPRHEGECLGFPASEDSEPAAAQDAALETTASETVAESHAETATVEEVHEPVYEPPAPETEPATITEIEVAPAAAAEAIPAASPEPVPEPEPETIQVRELPVYEVPVEPTPVAPPPEEHHHAPAAAAGWHTAPPPPMHVPPAAHQAPVYPATPHGYPPAYPAAGFVATPPAPSAPVKAPYSTPYNSPYGTPYSAPALPHQAPPSYAAPAPSATGYAPPQPGVLDPAHEKARRFAKLLVEEIKLYNQSKVAEGRARGDLYQRLREDIEKSRSAYRKRYGQTVPDVDYFSQELLRILADNNRALMGAGFPG